MYRPATLARCLLWFAAIVPAAAGAGPSIERWTTTAGARVFFVRATEIPIVDVRIVFDGGSARDGAQPGLAVLTSALLAEGADGMNADEFSAAMADTGANFSQGSARDMAWMSMRSMAEERYLTPALALFTRALVKPDFAQDAVSRERGRLLAAIEQGNESPDTIAEHAFYAALFRGHPYATPSEGTAESVSKLTPEDLRAFHAKYYVAANAVIAIVGDLTSAQARTLVDSLIAQLPRGQRAVAIPAAPELTASADIVIAHPSAQTHIWLGQPGTTRADPDYFTLLVGNHVLGGNGLVSILFNEIREKRGLSYSVYSSFSPMAGRGTFVSGLQTENSQAPEALAVLRATLRSFVEQGPDPTLLDAAKRNLIGEFPMRISSNGRIIEYIAMIGFYDLPLDYLETYRDRIAAVTGEQVKAAFQRRLNIDRMVTVTVGGGNAATES